LSQRGYGKEKKKDDKNRRRIEEELKKMGERIKESAGQYGHAESKKYIKGNRR